MMDKNLVKQYVDKIVEIIKAAYEEDAADHKSWQELCCWVNAYCQAEDSADLTAKDVARIYLAGLPPITEETMLEYFEEQIEACEDEEDADAQQERLDSVVRRVEGFFDDNER